MNGRKKATRSEAEFKHLLRLLLTDVGQPSAVAVAEGNSSAVRSPLPARAPFHRDEKFNGFLWVN